MRNFFHKQYECYCANEVTLEEEPCPHCDGIKPDPYPIPLQLERRECGICRVCHIAHRGLGFICPNCGHQKTWRIFRERVPEAGTRGKVRKVRVALDTGRSQVQVFTGNLCNHCATMVTNHAFSALFTTVTRYERTPCDMCKVW